MQLTSDCIHEKINRLGRPEKATFLSAFIFGLITHLFVFSNALLYHDAAYYMMESVGSTFASGRWGLGLLSKLTEFIGVTSHSAAFDGILSILFISLASMFIVKLLGTRSTVAAVIIGALLVAFPSVTATFAYMFTAAYYFFAFLLTALAIYLTTKEITAARIATSTLLLAFAIAIYQAYLSVALALVFSYAFINYVYGKAPFRTWIKNSLVTFGIVIAGALCYLIISKTLIAIMGINVTDYQGMDTAGQIDPLRLPMVIGFCYEMFLTMKWSMVGSGYGMNSSEFVQIVLIIISVLAAITLFIDTKTRWKKPSFLIITALFILLTPLFMNSIYIMSTSDSYWIHSLMMYSLAIYTAFIVSVFDHAKPLQRLVAGKSTAGKFGSAAIAFFLALIPLQYCYIDNVAYYRMSMVQTEMNSWFTVLVSEIKGCNGYKDDLPVAFIGNPGADDTTIFSYPQGQVGFMGFNYGVRDLISDFAWMDNMRAHTGYFPVTIDEDDIKTWAENDIVQAMPCYPDDGSIAIVDDTVVVKFED